MICIKKIKNLPLFFQKKSVLFCLHKDNINHKKKMPFGKLTKIHLLKSNSMK